MALLIGYGAGAINPYLAFESIEDLIARGHARPRRHRPDEGGPELHQGVRQGRAQGDVEDGRLDRRVVHRRPDLRGDRARRTSSSTSTSPAPCRSSAASASTRSPTRCARPPRAWPTRPGPTSARTASSTSAASTSGVARASTHLFNPDTVFKLQHATRAKRYDIFKEYTALVDDQSRKLATLRGLFEFNDRPSAAGADRRGRAGRATIVKRFSTGAMSYGSISAEAHETLAIAMNRIGGKSNTGEGGEDADRLHDPRAPLGDQAGRLGPLRRDVGVPHQRRRPADQDGAGRQAGRGRPAARATRCTRGSPRPGTPRPASA